MTFQESLDLHCFGFGFVIAGDPYGFSSALLDQRVLFIKKVTFVFNAIVTAFLDCSCFDFGFIL